MSRKRIRDLGVKVGRFAPGPKNSITDVPGVKVGHHTWIESDDIRTGVTAIFPGTDDPYQERVMASGFVLNGAGEVSGLTQVLEWGLIETPIVLCNTLSVGACSHAVTQYLLKKHPEIGETLDVVIPVVGECDDSWLNNAAKAISKEAHVLSALESASDAAVIEGSVGAGTGMITCDFKAGIGSASRRLPADLGGYNLGVLVLSNFGEAEDLKIAGKSLAFDPALKRRENYGSIIAVLATDAPLSTHQLQRLSKRVALGIGKVGSYAAHGSGEIVLAFSTANKVLRKSEEREISLRQLRDTAMDPLYACAVEATEEAILNALSCAAEMIGAGNRRVPALDYSQIL